MSSPPTPTFFSLAALTFFNQPKQINSFMTERYHIETIQTGFYMITASVMKELAETNQWLFFSLKY